ncbi:MAG: EcoKI restriction-modification system protein HsdS [Methanoregulaceae archaeon PtaB.Bin009]|jgi:type I restriction enzyme S subunit|nr:MAG: EcoKI restriction-modification system protein HsdS [Methanoregulaceae archaeon PtaB.Bin009]OPY42994.1 MAG: EcoKI restriction-modification system protein HsdS [Methanoregulaceae archaeon PtaU1.Bin066]
MNGESELPEGWVSAKLGDLISDIQPGFACGEHNREGDGYPHLRPMNISIDGKIDLTVVKYIPSEKVDTESKILQFGDVLFNNTNSTELVGKTAFYNLKELRAFSNHMTRIRCIPKILDSPYCALYIHELWREGYFGEHCNKHVSQSSISRNVLAETPINLPPLAEQRRIVAAVEQLLARVNASRERLDRVPGLLKTFRQAVLAAACSGRLTEGWREREENLEPISLFLKRTHLPKKVARGNFRLKQLDPSKLPILPKLWEWHHIHEVAERVTVGYVGPMKDEYVCEGIPFLRSQNVREGGFDPSGLIFISKEFHDKIKKSALEPRDLVIVRSGNVGTACVIPDNLTEANCSDLVIVKQPFGFISEYGAYFLNSVAKSEIDAGKVGIALSHFNTQSVANLPMPIPPLPEQHEIVRRVESLFAVADRIEQRVAIGKERADRLTQAILAKAFRGELVPTEAELARREGREYEPAGVLLERILASREKKDKKENRQ